MSPPPRTLRGGNSGPRVQPAPGNGALSYDPNTGVRVFTLVPANHTPGYYALETSGFCTVLGTGTYTSAYSWSQPGFGAASLAFGAVNLNATGLTFQVTRAVLSDGTLPILWTVTPAGVSGAPLVCISNAAQLLSLVPPS